MEKNLTNILADLIRFESITPNDCGCQSYIGNYLQKLGFSITQKKYGDVDNLIAKRGSSKPVVAFAGHTDVVPAGKISKWSSNPFELTKRGEELVGRGVADMKGSIACMLLAIENFCKKNPEHNGTIIVILTSDEEGPAINGIQKLVQENILQQYEINMCLIGEPTSKDMLGDTIKNGRRGSLSGKVNLHGLQGHVAYPQNSINPIHEVVPIINELINTKYDSGNEFFPPTSFQISNINSGVGADNVIPGELSFNFNFRYSPEITKDQLTKLVEDAFKKTGLRYDVEWNHSGEPYLTTKKELIKVCEESINEVLNFKPKITADGGTSDGRFIAKICDQVVEFGLINKSIHQIDENIKEEDLSILSKIYEKILVKIFKL